MLCPHFLCPAESVTVTKQLASLINEVLLLVDSTFRLMRIFNTIIQPRIKYKPTKIYKMPLIILNFLYLMAKIHNREISLKDIYVPKEKSNKLNIHSVYD